MTTAEAMYREGRLRDAIAALNERLRASPDDHRARVFLAELLCFAGEIERADRTADLAGTASPEAAVQAARLRHVLRAALARHEVWSTGRVPEFRSEPSAALRAHLAALVALRAGDLPAAAAALAEAEAARAPVTASLDGRAVGAVRDADDVTAGFLEVLTAGGSYYWIGFEELRSVVFSAPATPLDLLWRQARVEFADGTEGSVSVAAIYPGSERSDQDAIRLGRVTDWQPLAGEMMRGLGQRCLFAADELHPITGIGRLDFAAG